MNDVQKKYSEFWKEIVENDDGTINKDQLMKELHDFSTLIDNLTTIYCHISGNRCSKPITPAHVVINLYDEFLQNKYNDGYADGFEDGFEDGINGVSNE